MNFRTFRYIQVHGRFLARVEPYKEDYDWMWETCECLRHLTITELDNSKLDFVEFLNTIHKIKEMLKSGGMGNE